MSFIRGMHPLALAAIGLFGAVYGGLIAAVLQSKMGLPGKIILVGLCVAGDLGTTWALVSVGRRRSKQQDRYVDIL